jgi:hypothetical protein
MTIGFKSTVGTAWQQVVFAAAALAAAFEFLQLPAARA